MGLKIYFAIIAKDEESSIKLTIRSLFSQTIFHSERLDIDYINVSIFANGCSDNTARIAKDSFKELCPESLNFKLETSVIEYELGDKATTWNRFVHENVKCDANYLFMMDADILIDKEATCEILIKALEDNSTAVMSSAVAIKDTSVIVSPSLLDKCANFITKMEHSVRFSAVTGALMCGRYDFLKKIWLPSFLLNIDGIMTTIAKTDFFSAAETKHECVINPPGATFIFEAYRDIRLLYFNHCRRYIGFVIREYLTKELGTVRSSGMDPAEWLKDRYQGDPGWLQVEMANKVKNEKGAIIPWSILTLRINQFRADKANRKLRNIPIIILATVWQALVLAGVKYFLAKGDLRRVWKNSHNARLVEAPK